MQEIDKTDEKLNPKQISKMSFQDIVQIILVHKWVILLVFLASFGPTVYYVKTTPYIYESKVLMMRETASEKLPASIIGVNVESDKLDSGQEMLLKSIPLLQGIQKKLSDQSFNVDIKQLSGWLTLSYPKNSANVIQLTAKANTAEQAQAIANISAEAYVTKLSEMKKSQLGQGLDFLKQQMDQLESRIKGTEKALSTFKDKEGIIASTSETDSNGLLGKLGNIQSDLLQAENDAELTKTQLQTIEQLIEEKKKFAKTSSASGVSAQMDQVREKIINLQIELSNKLETQTDMHPDVIAIKKKMVAAQAQLDLELNKMFAETGTTSLDPLTELQDLMQQYVTMTVQLKSMDKRATLMKDRLIQFRSEHPELASKQVELMQLERQSRVYEQAYSTLTSKYEDMRLTEQMKVSGLKVIDPAPLPGSPISPKVNMSLAMGALLGLMLGVMLVFFLHYIDDTINTEEDAQRYLNLPLLGTIPKITPYEVPETAINKKDDKTASNGNTKRNSGNSDKKSRSEMQSLLGHSILYAPKNSHKSNAKESYRNLSVNIQFASVDKPIKSLLVTSSIPGEGKTTTASNLAMTMARPDLKVLLIDADVRRPRLHRILGQNRLPGLTDILISSIEDSGRLLSDCIHATSVNNLYLLPCGSHISNMESLLASQKMTDLIDTLKHQYDMVILDSPPILSVADSIAIGNKVDGVLLVLFSGKTDSKTANRSMNALKRVNANIIGTIVTDVDYAKHYGYYRYYRYYYQYYHHYGTEGEKDAD
jgi:succinoglycan biosynthesis transport protein ExoP